MPIVDPFENKNGGIIDPFDNKAGKPTYPKTATEATTDNVPEWGRRNPNLYGLYGAGGGLLKEAVRPSVETAAMIGGSFVNPVAGGALAWGSAKKGMDIAEDVYAKMGGEPSGFDKPGMGLSVSGVAKETLGSAVDVGGAMAVGKTFDIAGKSLFSAEQKLTNAIRNGIEKGIRPSVVGKGTSKNIEMYLDRAESGVKSIVYNKDNLQLTDKKGEAVVGRLPKTLKEFGQAITQTKQRIFDQYDALQQTAGQQGARVGLSPIIKELETVVADPAMAVSPAAKNHAQKMIGELSAVGSFSPGEAQRAIAKINSRLDTFYKNPSYQLANTKSVDDLIVTHLRQSLDDVIEKTTGAQYQELKNAYGSLRAIEKDVNHRAGIDARKNKIGFLGYADIWTAAEVVSAIADPSKLPRAVAIQGTKKWIDHINNPNRYVKNMFGEAEHLMKKIPPKIQQEIIKKSPIEITEQEVYRYNPGFKGTKTQRPAPLKTELHEGAEIRGVTPRQTLLPDQRATVIKGKSALQRANEERAKRGLPLIRRDFTPGSYK